MTRHRPPSGQNSEAERVLFSRHNALVITRGVVVDVFKTNFVLVGEVVDELAVKLAAEPNEPNKGEPLEPHVVVLWRGEYGGRMNKGRAYDDEGWENIGGG